MLEVTHRANPDDVLRGRVTSKGAAELIIETAGELRPIVSLRLPSAWLTPAQQIAWLERLALAAEDLCEQIRVENDMETIRNTAHQGIRYLETRAAESGEVTE